MRVRKEEQVIANQPTPTGYCKECSTPLYDGRMKVCPACKAAIKKTKCKRPSAIKKYTDKELLLSALTDLKNSNKMLEWMILENKDKITKLEAIIFSM